MTLHRLGHPSPLHRDQLSHTGLARSVQNGLTPGATATTAPVPDTTTSDDEVSGAVSKNVSPRGGPAPVRAYLLDRVWSGYGNRHENPPQSWSATGQPSSVQWPSAPMRTALPCGCRRAPPCTGSSCSHARRAATRSGRRRRRRGCRGSSLRTEGVREEAALTELVTAVLDEGLPDVERRRLACWTSSSQQDQGSGAATT